MDVDMDVDVVSEPAEPTNRSRRTQRALRDALMELALEKGIEQVTVRDITERAGTDRTTFYLHFRDKRALLEESRRQLLDELVALGRPSQTVGDRIRAAFRHMAEHAVAYRVLLASADPEVDRGLHDYLAQHIARMVQEHIQTGEATPAPPADLLHVDLFAQYIAGGVRAVARWWLEEGMPYTPEEMAEVLQRLLPAGVRAQGAAHCPPSDRDSDQP